MDTNPHLPSDINSAQEQEINTEEQPGSTAHRGCGLLAGTTFLGAAAGLLAGLVLIPSAGDFSFMIGMPQGCTIGSVVGFGIGIVWQVYIHCRCL